jgi:predicted nucleotide-binding protein (sugar kinase/HSP70/actin superfamily)
MHTRSTQQHHSHLKGADSPEAGGYVPRFPAAGEKTVSGPHYRLAPRAPFTRRERDAVTVIFGGLTPAHERLFKALLESRGFRVAILPTPTLADYQVGRRYANNGFCNPLYFTGGSLINFLRCEEAAGLSRSDVCRRYVYITTRSAGPCRLGVYEQEYRNMLVNAGYASFRVFAFSDTLSMETESGDEGFPFDLHFYANLLSALMVGDTLNDLANRTRPYECRPGATDDAWEEAVRYAEKTLRTRPPLNAWMERRLPSWLRAPLTLVGRMLTWSMDLRLLRVILHARRRFRAVRVNPLRVCPAVKLIGEFWAQTTLGDGNFRAHSFLERHGAEIVVEPISVWVLYLLFEADQNRRLRLRQHFHNRGSGVKEWLRSARRVARSGMEAAVFRLAELLFRLKYNLIRGLFSFVPDRLPDIRDFGRLAKEYYNPFLAGGESHMEVGKTLYYTQTNRVHLILSLKPFGCLPSGMSDGVQPLVRAQHPETLFLSIETSGEGSTNAQSRMLMVLNTAEERARRELLQAQKALQDSGKHAEAVRERFSGGVSALRPCRFRRSYAARAAEELAALLPKNVNGKRSRS